MDAAIERRIGQNIRALREKVNLTQEMMAAQLQVRGCDMIRSALAKIEVGQRHLYPDDLIAIRDVLGVSYDDLLAP